MTPFGEHLRLLREKRGISQKKMAEDIGVSAAYLSALEHGKRGRPSFDFIQRVITYFNVIWDEADEILLLAGVSHPRVVLDTSGLSAKATQLANRLANEITGFDSQTIDAINSILDQQKSRIEKNG